jgi:RHS repeat-associated protein
LLIAFGNNRMTRYTYDPRTFRLQRQRTEGYSKNVAGDTITYAYTSGTNKQDDGFNYDLAGNIVNIFTRVTDCGIQGSIPGKDALNREFGYDALYRLTFVDGREADTQSGNSYLYDDAPAPGTPNANNVRSYERTYNYDKLGNMLSVVQAGLNGFTRAYTYNTGKNTLQKIEDGSSNVLESYSYDSCGNTLNSSLNRKYTWNHADQLICYKNQVGAGIPTVYAQYDYAGQDRVSKMVRTGSHYERTIYIDGIFEYVWYDDGTLYQKNYIHVMDDTSRIAEIRVGDVFPTDINDSITYILEDQIGSSVMRLSTSGTVIDEEEYYPFGDSSLRTFTYKRYRYVGKEKDAESGLYYYGARYYAAWTCRFISVDPLSKKYANLSPYNYADNNPINDFDIDGMQNNNSQQTPDKSETSRQDNTAVANKGKELAAKSPDDFKKAVSFKLTVDNTNPYTPPGKSEKHEINVNNSEAYKTVMQDELFGSILSGMVQSGLITNGSEVSFKWTGNETTTNTSGESLAFKYDLSFTNGNEKMTVPVTVSEGEIVRFTGSHPIDYPLALIGSGAYSQLFKKVVIANAEKELLKTVGKSNFNVYGEGEAARFIDVAVNPEFANGRVLSSTIPSGSAKNIMINNSPLFAEELSEIARLTKSGSHVSYTAPAGTKFFGALSQQMTNVGELLKSEIKNVSGVNMQTVLYRIK